MNHSIQPNNPRFDEIAGNYSRSGFIEFARFWAKQSQHSSQQPAADHEVRSAHLLKSLQSAEDDLYQALDGLYYYGQTERSQSLLQNAFQSLYNWSRALHISRLIERDIAFYNQPPHKEDEFGLGHLRFQIINRIENALNTLQLSDNRLLAVNTILNDLSTYQYHAAFDPVITPYFHRLQKGLDAALLDLILESEHSISTHLQSAQFEKAEECVESHSHLYDYTNSSMFIGLTACKELFASSMTNYFEQKNDMDAACQEKDFIHALQTADKMLGQFPHDEWVIARVEEIEIFIHQKETLKTGWQKWCDLAMNPGEKISRRKHALKSAHQLIQSSEAYVLFDAAALQWMLNETNGIQRNVNQCYFILCMAQSIVLTVIAAGSYYGYHTIDMKSLPLFTNTINAIPSSVPTPVPIAMGTINTAFKNLRVENDFRSAAPEHILFILYKGDVIELIEKGETSGHNTYYRARIKKGHTIYFPEKLKENNPQQYNRFAALVQNQPEMNTVSKLGVVSYYGTLKEDQYVWVYAGENSLDVQLIFDHTDID